MLLEVNRGPKFGVLLKLYVYSDKLGGHIDIAY